MTNLSRSVFTPFIRGGSAQPRALGEQKQVSIINHTISKKYVVWSKVCYTKNSYQSGYSKGLEVIFQSRTSPFFGMCRVGFRHPKLTESILYYTYTKPLFQLAFSHTFSCTEKGRSCGPHTCAPNHHTSSHRGQQLMPQKTSGRRLVNCRAWQRCQIR